MKFAFIIMGPYRMEQDQTSMHEGMAEMVGVSSLEEACTAARTLQEKGIDCIELCGAFGETGARAVISATKNQLPVGYVTHLPEQDFLFEEISRSMSSARSL